MPDQPGKGPPSSAPLSVEDADRIADGFTPFWEDEGDTVPAATPAPPPVEVTAAPAPPPVEVTAAPAPPPVEVTAAPAPPPVEVAAAPFVVPRARKPVGQQTLLGMAPPTIEHPSARPPAPNVTSVVETQKLPVVAPVATAAPSTITQPLPAVVVPKPTAPAHPARKSSPDVPGYAIAYTPKDGPSTPAVVIAPEAQSEPQNKRPMSLTLPAGVRFAPLHAKPAAVLDDDFDPYGPKKGKGKLIGVLLGGAALIALGVFAMRGSGDSPPAPVPTVASQAPTARVEATAAVPVETAPAAAADPTPNADPKPNSVVTPKSRVTADKSAPVVKREPAPAAPKPAVAARPKAEPAAVTPTRPAARPSVAVVPEVTNNTPAKPASRGVIVRDAPF